MPSFQVIADKTSIVLSALCVVHCLATPILLVLLPALAGTVFVSEEVHEWLLYAVLPISVVALGFGFFQHHNRSVVVTGLVGLSMLLAIVLMGHDRLGHELEIALTVVGAAIVAFSHYKNIRLANEIEFEIEIEEK